MHNTKRKYILYAYRLFELLILATCFITSLHGLVENVRLFPFDELMLTKVRIKDVVYFLLVLTIWEKTFSVFDLYQSRRLSRMRTEIIDILKASFLSSIIVYFIAVLIHLGYITPIFIVFFGLLSSSIIISFRLTFRFILKKIRAKGRNLRRILVVGTNKRAIKFAKMIISTPEIGYRLVGFADDIWHCKDTKQNEFGAPIVCGLADISEFVRNEIIDDVMLAIPVKSYYSVSSDIVSICENQGIIVRHISDIYNISNGNTEIDYIGGIPSLQFYKSKINGWREIAKRLIDICLSTIILIIFSPLFIITGLLIAITSPGPIIFVQKRIGLNKRIINIYKFRTMSNNAEERINDLGALNEASGPVFKIKDDPRITPLGKFLRKGSIDELPQLINVLKGDMSVVGPRPLPVRDYEGFSIDWHRRRFSVKPGITCLWQVNGRHNLQFDKWMELDMDYIDNWSLLLDFKILLKTIPAVLSGKGAS